MSDTHAQILVIDSSKVARRMIERALKQALADVENLQVIKAVIDPRL